ncbi:Retinoic acid induced 16-like protein [Metarhizium album ARSEF 1941]|uniref:Retinoic acid induced 16-like protein n=1 Tax=Metarhizium album (strain ARSEF 1941) TaxID=1081103 RepID=A0A0B2WUZ3_METAS|nr:Retinoic acid induced 16-like protein [Metarhizium album ARSEF 1941]KHN97247.1 Retinoic acid induced 16-like protein [Metarhizium album ARSEF 1941]
MDFSTWRTSSNLSRDSEAAETLEIRLQELTNILSDESRRPLPHPCIQYASIKQIYVPIGKIATSSYNEWIIKEAVLFFATLIESEEEAFVENPTFSSSLTNLLVRITGVNSVRLGLDTESRVVELAFNITTKIRLDPAILPAWFKTPQLSADQNTRQHLDERERFAGRTQRVDFPLFYILMDYIHHEGKVGDFARTGLLYIIEAASSSATLEQWIVESDLSTLMATGLGALYSQLSRKLVIDHLPHDLPPTLALSDYEHPTSNYEIISSCSPEFQSHLETFLSHLLFWQDVLNHCRSVEVKSTLLEHFQVIFLQQLLYPSLLESSDIDGGSSVAVLTYLRRILESLDHPDMIHLILHYLLALPDSTPPNKKPAPSLVSAARKRKSMDLTKMMSEKAEEPATPLLFNLVDLILSCLRSRNQQTIHVTLQLVSAILKRHHRYAVFTLLRTDVLPSHTKHRTVGAHEQEVNHLVYLAGSIGGRADLDEMYAGILRDTSTRLESHPCSLRLLAPKVSTNQHQLPDVPDSLPGAPRDVKEHTLRPDDPLLNIMLDLLETFFVNSVETNLSLTETIVDLGICGYMSIEGWLARSPSAYVYEDGDEELERGYETSVASEAAAEPPPQAMDSALSNSLDEARRMKDMERCRTAPQWEEASLPRVLNVLKRLCDQVAKYKQTIPRFDELLEQRRDAFQTAESMLDNPPPPARKASPTRSGTPEHASLDETLRTGSPPRPSAIEGFAQRLLSELGTPSRSASPKGRKEQSRSSGASTPGSQPPGPEFMTPKAVRVPPKDFAMNYNDPSESGTRGFSPGSGARPDIGPRPEERDKIAESQAAAFAAIDQSILSRRVGLPNEKLEPIPLDLTKKPRDDHVDEAEALVRQGHSDGAGSVASANAAEDVDAQTSEEKSVTASVSHVLTNAIIFQSFLLELASLWQTRAGLFDEVRYV